MELLEITRQTRRDCRMNIKCEGCKNEEQNVSAYDDRNFWDNVLPNMKCPECEKSRNDLGSDKQSIATKYPEGHQV